jgi:ligand-binding sensor domain-containing protein
VKADMWKPIEEADTSYAVGVRSARIVGCNDRGEVFTTFFVRHEKGNDWLIATGEGLMAWEPTMWVPLPEPYQDKDGLSYQYSEAIRSAKEATGS